MFKITSEGGIASGVRRIEAITGLSVYNYLNEKEEEIEELSEILKNKTGKGRLSEVKNLVKDTAYCQRPNVGCGTPVSKIRLDHKKSDLSIRLIAEIKVDGTKEEGNQCFKDAERRAATFDYLF